MQEIQAGSPGHEDPWHPLQYSSLENSMDSPWGRKELDMSEQLTFTFKAIWLILFVFPIYKIAFKQLSCHNIHPSPHLLCILPEL